jgi:hypothetical protein
VRRAVNGFRSRFTSGDLLLVVLIGHGTFDGADAKFNLVGPDLTLAEWADLTKSIQGRLVFVNAASGSFPFLARLSGRNRIVITANAVPAQQFETVFPEYFVEALAGLAADSDRNGKVSIWEAFTFAADRVHRWFEERGQLPTERALLDDNGDGLGREARSDGADGALSIATFLRPQLAIVESADGALGVLLKRRAALEKDLEALRARKAAGELTGSEYEAQLEPVLLEIARLDRRIRTEKR